LTVSLFPFLSVLLCTLGSLILLLLILDREARRQRELEAQRLLAQPVAGSPPMADGPEEAEDDWLWESFLLLARHELCLSQERLEAHLADAEAEEARLAQEFAQLQVQLHDRRRQTQRMQQQHAKLAASRHTLSAQIAHEQADRRQLQERIAALERLADRLRQATQQLPPRYSLIPYQGRLGQLRKPIYLECVGQQAVFRPDGPALFVTDLLERDRLLEHIRRRQQDLQPEARPYVLVLVRPSGIPTYYLVLRALDDAEVDLGYELIEEDWLLDYAEPTEEDLRAEEARWRAQAQAGADGPAGAVPAPRPGQPASGATVGLGPPASRGQAAPSGSAPARPAVPAQQASKVPRPVPVGGSGNDRPMVLECRADGIVAWPDRTLLAFDPSSATDPTQTLGHRLQQYLDRRQRLGLTGPAPVQVYVRPSGLRSYYRLAALVESQPVRLQVEMIRADTRLESLLP
jgi:hypothetical protein